MSVSLKSSTFKWQTKRVSKQLVEWGFSREKYLNIVSPPYISSEIFLDIILNFVKKHKKVLYVTNQKDFNIEIIEKIKKKSNFRKYTYIRENSDFKESLLIISRHDMLYKVNCKCDLVIYNDTKGFSKYTAYQIIDAMTSKVTEEGKLITCSIEKIFNNKKELVLPVRNNEYPLIEPKFISTRVDINKDIPYMVYEYLEWSLKFNLQKVVVYVPNEQKINNVFKYLSLYCSKLNKNVYTFVEGKSNKKVLNNFLKMKEGLMITNDYYCDINNSNVMVFFADDKKFNYKKLIYLSGKVGKNSKKPRGEVIFLGNSETDEIDKAKNIARNFNKEAWEMNLLRL